MKSISMFFISIGVILFLAGCKGKEESAPKGQSGADTVAVTIQQVAKSDMIISKTFTATLEGEEQANVTSKLAERITAIKCKVGQSVNAGEVLVTLDKSGPTSQFLQAEAGYKNAAKDLERMTALLKEGAISQQMHDGVQTQFAIAKANFEAAKSMVELPAPISGIVTAINVRIGDNANPMMPVLTIAKIGFLKAIFNAGDADAAKLSIGKQVVITNEARSDLSVTGSINQVASSADDQSRAFEVKALLRNTPDKWLRPGMFCKVNTVLDSKKDVVCIPVSAIVLRGADRLVYVSENGKAVERKIQVGLSDGSKTEILSGLQPGEYLVVVGANELQTGTFVRNQAK